MNSVAVGLQVRLDSLRLPGKALLPLGDRTVIEHAMAALTNVPGADLYILTDESSVERLTPPAEMYGFTVMAGPRDDVLRRYATLAETSGADTLIRATGDNPLVSPRMAGRAVQLRGETGADLCAFDNLPLGTGVEVLASEAIARADAAAARRDEREHVTLHLYRHRDSYRIDRRPAPPEATMAEGRVTLDTREDYELIREVFRRKQGGTPIEVESVIDALRSIVAEGRVASIRG